MACMRGRIIALAATLQFDDILFAEVVIFKSFFHFDCASPSSNFLILSQIYGSKYKIIVEKGK